MPSGIASARRNSLSLFPTMAQKPRSSFSDNASLERDPGSPTIHRLRLPLYETALMRASYQHVVPAPFFLSRPGCFRRPVRGPNLLSVYCQPSLLSGESLFKRDGSGRRRRQGQKGCAVSWGLGCVKIEGH